MTEDQTAASRVDQAESDGEASLRELREYARGVLDVEHSDLHPHAGLIDDENVEQVLSFLAENYDPERIDGEVPRSFWETDLAEHTMRKHATRTASRAVREGDALQTAYITGLPSYQSDVSGLHALNQLADWLVHSEQCKLIYVASLMGRGKTDLCSLWFEVIADHYDRVQRSTDEQVTMPEFASNFYLEAPDREVAELHSERELLEWAEGGSSDDNKWMIFDEASTELTAQSGKNAQKVAETFAPFVKKMRKVGVNLIVVGHDKGDVHPAVRSLADFVEKPSLKTARFYAGIEQREPTGHLFDLHGLPPTSWEFDTDDVAEWTWLADEDGEQEEIEVGDYTEEEVREWRDERIARLYDQADLSQRALAEAMGVSQGLVSRAVQNIEVEHDGDQRQPMPGD
jgi:predicted XRE-type DNA-binding protein